MKAMVYTQYGSPDVLQLTEVAKPVPTDDEVLVKVHAASVTAGDWQLLRGTPFLVRMDAGLRKPSITILGADVAGQVEAVGSQVTQFQPGDAVFGDISRYGYGAFAEYVAVPEGALVHKPDTITFEQAAAVPVSAVTALQALRDKGQIQPGQQVLINGASGGVGSFAVQIAKSFGAEVTAVVSTAKMDVARSAGADHVIDYTQEDVTQNGYRYDLIVDLAAHRAMADYKRVLTPQGIYVMVGGAAKRMLQAMVLGPWISRRGGKQMGMMMAKPNTGDLSVVKDLLETGHVAPVIDRRFPFRDLPDALRYVEAGRARGKVVITVADDSVA